MHDSIFKDWGLIYDGKKLETHSSFIYFTVKNNKKTVLKVFKPDSDEKNSADILDYYNGNGAVRVLNKSNEAVLLDKIGSNKDLNSIDPTKNDDKAVEIFCDVVKKLHSVNIKTCNVKRVSSLISDFDECSNDEMLLAKSMFSELISDEQNMVLLHGDLHHSNILYDDEKKWIAIDPKGYIGEQEFEVGAFLRNPISNPEFYTSEEVFKHRIDIISKKLGFDKVKMLKWTYVLTILAVSHGIQDKNHLEGWVRFSLMLKKSLS